MLMNAWMMLVLMKCKCQMQCLTLGCYRALAHTSNKDQPVNQNKKFNKVRRNKDLQLSMSSSPGPDDASSSQKKGRGPAQWT